VAPGDDVELRVGDERGGSSTDLGAAVGILVAPDHEHGRGDAAQFIVGEEVLLTGPPEAHGEPHVAHHRRSIAGLAHSLVNDVKEAVRRSLRSTGSDNALTVTANGG
jgi:hypothetical protein